MQQSHQLARLGEKCLQLGFDFAGVLADLVG